MDREVAELVSKILFVVVPIVMVSGWILYTIYQIRQYKSIMDRARKIDPTVKTRAEADYVLKKDIAESMGKNNTNNL